MENSGSGIFRFLKIQSDDPRVIRQSRLVQVLVGLIILGALRGILISLNDMTTGELSALDVVVFSVQIGALLLFAGLTLYLLHRGRFLIALKLCFIILNLILYSLLISTEGAGPFHLLLLISVFSIAALQSIRVSAIYLVVIIAVVSYYYIFIQPNDVESTISFIQVSLLLTAPSWFFANDLRRSRDRAQELAQTLETTVNNLDKRAKQLEQIAEVGRVATSSLDQEKLVRNSVKLIQSQFGFYHVSLYLMTPDGSRLVLQEAIGDMGQFDALKGEKTTVGQVSIVGWVAMNQQARIALDVGDAPYYFENPKLPDTHSEIALPLLARGRLLGVLDIQSRESSAFQAEDMPVFQVMADQIAVGIDNARLFEDISEQAKQLTELQNITNLMSQQANIKNALNVVAKRAISLFRADGGGVVLYRPDKDVLEYVISLTPDDPRLGQTLKIGEGLSGQVFDENKTMMIEDYDHWSGRAKHFARSNVHTIVAVPLRRQNEPIGAFTLTRSWAGEPFKPEEIQIAELLASQISAVILNNQLVEETRRLIRRERSVNQAAAEIRRSLDAKTILDTMTNELGDLLGNRVVKARLYPQQDVYSEEKETL